MSQQASQSPALFVLLERAWDATPQRVHFGSLQHTLCPVARYWWKQKEGGSKLLELAAYSARRQPGAGAPSVGILELLGRDAGLATGRRS
jgi:hypothetical protein